MIASELTLYLAMTVGSLRSVHVRQQVGGPKVCLLAAEMNSKGEQRQ